MLSYAHAATVGSCRLVLVCASAVGKNREIKNKNENTTFLDENRRKFPPTFRVLLLFVAIQLILDVRLHISVNMWTHQPESHRRKPSFCGACLNFLSREGSSRPFPSSTVKSIFLCTHDVIVLLLLGMM